MGRKTKLARLTVVMNNTTGNLFVVNYVTENKVCMSNQFIAYSSTITKFHKEYEVIGKL